MDSFDSIVGFFAERKKKIFLGLYGRELDRQKNRCQCCGEVRRHSVAIWEQIVKSRKVATRLGALGGLLSLAVVSSPLAQTIPPAAPIGSGKQGAALPVGSLNLPLVSPGQAASFLAARAVPASTMPALAADRMSARQAPAVLNVQPVLGHELPTGSRTAAGLPRAGFAIAKPGSDAKALQRAVMGLTEGGSLSAPLRNRRPAGP